MKKLTFSLLIATVLNVANVFAQDCDDSGTTGPLQWCLKNGTLTISGTGAMPDYGWDAPWYEYLSPIHTVVMQTGVTSIGDNAFRDLEKLTSITIPNSVKTIGDWAFQDCWRLTSITIPNSVISIGRRAFYWCDEGLTSITIPNSVTSIGEEAFYHCLNLTSITLSNNLTSIEDGTFYECKKMASITVPSSVTNIGKSAFRECTSLTSLTIPNSVTSIKENAFSGCTGLTSITTNAIDPPALSSDAFKYVSKDIPVKVPCGSYESYMNAPGWGDYFTNIISGAADKQQICMISVNDNNHNEVTWKKQEEVSSYKIYREETQGGEYDLVATIAYNAPNIWVDTESNAKTRSYRYKISATNDVCESVLSEAHQTMCLTINAGVGNSWHLSWTAYEGIEYSLYNIYRSSGETIGEWQFIGNVPVGTTSFSDFSAPEGYIYYMVEIWLNETCNAGKGSSVKSNIATNNPNVAIDEQGIGNITVYPNPTNYELGIKNWELGIGDYHIFNMMGQTVMQGRLSDETTTINVESLPSGMYFLKIAGKAVKFVKQ